MPRVVTACQAVFGAFVVLLLAACGGGSHAPDIVPGNGNREPPRTIYVADARNDRIVRMDDMDGTNWTSFGTMGSGVGQFQQPRGIAVDAQDRIYVADANNGRIVRMDDMNGTNWTEFSQSGDHKVVEPFCIALDAQGRIYFSSGPLLGQVLVRVDDMNGTNWTTSPLSPSSPYGTSSLAIDKQGRIYWSDWSGGFTRMDDMDGSGLVRFLPEGQGSSGAIAVDAQGHVYTSRYTDPRVARMDDMQGTNRTFLTRDGLEWPVGPLNMFVDDLGHIYMVGSGTFQRVDDMSGTNWKSYTRSGSAAGEIAGPIAIFVR